MKALEKKVEARYQTAAEFLKDLKAAARDVGAQWRSGVEQVEQTDRRFQARDQRLCDTDDAIAAAAFFASVNHSSFHRASGLLIWAVYYFWPRTYYQPSSAALHWYEQGTESLRNGAYYQASKALTQAIQIDDGYALAHARLAQAWAELDYSERAKDELLAATSQNGSLITITERCAVFGRHPSNRDEKIR